MPAPQKLPDPTTWRFVLVHRTARHGSSILVSGYDEAKQSFLSVHHGEIKPTVCIRTNNLRDRLMKLGGWEDITREVGPLTPRCWDERKGKWKPDPEGWLPWERKPGQKLRPVPAEEPEEEPEEELSLVELPAPPSSAEMSPPSSEMQTSSPSNGQKKKAPSRRPRS